LGTKQPSELMSGYVYEPKFIAIAFLMIPTLIFWQIFCEWHEEKDS